METFKDIDQNTLNTCANSWVGMDAQAAKQGLVERLAYREDLMEELESRYEIFSWDNYAADQVRVFRRIELLWFMQMELRKWIRRRKHYWNKKHHRHLRKLKATKRSKDCLANSPGGSALTSDMIHHAIEKSKSPSLSARRTMPPWRVLHQL